MASLFRNMPTKRVTLLHSNGQITPHIKALINDKGNTTTILLEGAAGFLLAGDRIETTTEEGMTLCYQVTDPGYHPRQFGASSYYSARVKKAGEYYRTASEQTYIRPGTTSEQVYTRPDTATDDALLFETLRTFVTSQPDSQTLLFFIREMENVVGTPHYPALYDAFIQTIAGRIPQFAYFIPHLSHLLLQSSPSS